MQIETYLVLLKHLFAKQLLLQVNNGGEMFNLKKRRTEPLTETDINCTCYSKGCTMSCITDAGFESSKAAIYRGTMMKSVDGVEPYGRT